MPNPLAFLKGAQVALSGIRAAKRVHETLSEPDTTGVSFVDRVRTLVTGAESVPEVADDEPRPLRVSAPKLRGLYVFVTGYAKSSI